VQLTWKNNYLALGKALGLGDDLAKNPDHVLDPDIAYEIMSYGMRNGSFSKGQTLSRYINAITCDYLGVRRIINGQDVAALITARNFRCYRLDSGVGRGVDSRAGR
jgi:putative chitinase